VLSDQWLAAPAQEAAEDERDDHDVVELTGDGDEVRREIEGEREVARQRNEQRLLTTRHARVTEQSAAEDDAVWDEAGERAGALAPAGDDEREDDRDVKEEEDADRDERPCQEGHAHEASDPRAEGNPAALASFGLLATTARPTSPEAAGGYSRRRARRASQ
jgi:hypothetical protein